MKKYFILLFLLFPLITQAKSPDCYHWPMSMAEVWMKNTNIVDIADLNESKTRVTRLASERKGPGRYTQIYHFVFYDRRGAKYEVITQSDAGDEECSLSSVNSYLVSRSDITH